MEENDTDLLPPTAQADKPMLCDLHVHSNCSDGSFPPEKLIGIAKAAGVKAVALCDHNTVSGLPRFRRAGADSGVTAVPGVEITAGFGGKEVHILGLFLPEESDEPLTAYLEEINRRKAESNKALAARLSEAGFSVDYDDVVQKAGGAVPNRVHFGRSLLENGYVSSISEAFESILAEDGSFYRPPEKLDSLEVIAFLKSVSAVPVLAHPFLNLSLDELREFLPRAREQGLVGMETIYPLFSQEESEAAAELARQYGLLPSGGSDFHGSNKPDIKMGTGRDNMAVPFAVYAQLRAAAAYPGSGER